MRSLLAAAVTLFALASMNNAGAADLPVKAPPPAPADPAPYNWTGFYVGGNGGYAWTDPKAFPLAATQSVAPLAGAGPLTWQADGIFPRTSNLGQSGAIGGLQAGYNWQFSSWVTGVEADLDYSSASRSWPTAGCCSAPGAAGATSNISRRLDALGTLRARFGFAADRSLFYVTGGLAVGESTLGYAAAGTNVLGSLGSTLNSTTVWQAGWTLGGGIEYAPWQHWSVKAEYLYYDLGPQSTTIASNVPALPGESWTATTTVRNNGQFVRAGLNYKF
jgi:outer membrane immunogenic protein